jgi:hypothetical protein
MAFGFSSVGHFFAAAASDLVKAAKVVSGVADKVQAVAPNVQELEPVIEGIEQGLIPTAVPITRAAFFFLGEALAAVQSGKNVVQIAESDIASMKKEILPVLAAFAKSQGIASPAQ